MAARCQHQVMRTKVLLDARSSGGSESPEDLPAMMLERNEGSATTGILMKWTALWHPERDHGIRAKGMLLLSPYEIQSRKGRDGRPKPKQALDVMIDRNGS